MSTFVTCTHTHTHTPQATIVVPVAIFALDALFSSEPRLALHAYSCVLGEGKVPMQCLVALGVAPCEASITVRIVALDAVSSRCVILT